MSQRILFIKLLLVHYAAQNPTETRANCGQDVSLKCANGDIDSMNFLSVTWYKHSERKHGIIRKNKGEEKTQSYNFPRRASFGEKYSLSLPSVTPEDSGKYECTISANVGGTNQHLEVILSVAACVTEPTTTTYVPNTTQSDAHCDKQVDLPVSWTVVGYVAVGITKIALSLIIILIIQAVRNRSSRRRQQRW